MRRTVALIVTAAVLASGCTSSVGTKATGSASAKQSAGQPAAKSTVAPAWSSVLSQVSADGSVDTAAALQAFSLAFGPLPGVTVPAGAAGILPDGTGPMRWLIGHWHDLSAAQQAAALRLLPLPPTPAAAGSSSAALGEAGGGVAEDAAYQPVSKYQQQRSDFFYTQAATQAAQDIAAEVGRPLGIPITVHVNGLVTGYEGATGAYSASNGYTGTAARCSIVLSVAGDQLDGPNLDLMLHHEVWHCFEAAVIGLTAYYSPAVPQWIIEGEAEWVGTTSSPTASEAGQFWPDYLRSPAIPLFKRSYDAEGFFAQVQESDGDMWSQLIPVLQASGNPAAFEAAGGTGDPFLDAWASGYFRDSSRGTPWDIVGAGVTPNKPTPSTITVPKDSTVAVGTQPYTDQVFTVVPGNADLEQFTFSGHARVSDDSGHDYLVQNSMLACVNPAGCTCPKGSTGQPPPSMALPGTPIDLAVSGDPAGDTGTVHGESLNDFCQSCTANGSAVPAGRYSGPVKVVLVTTLHISSKVISEGSGTTTLTGTITVVSDGTNVTGSIHLSGGGKSQVGVKDVIEFSDSAIGQLDGTISGPATAPTVKGTMKASDEAAGNVSSPLSAGLHLTQVGCTSISGDLVAMFTELEKPVAQYLTLGGSGAWTVPRIH